MSYDLMHIVGPCLIGYAVGLLCGYLLARSWRTRRRGWALRATLDNGKIIFELGGVPADFAKQVLRLVAFKLSLRTKFVTREGH